VTEPSPFEGALIKAFRDVTRCEREVSACHTETVRCRERIDGLTGRLEAVKARRGSLRSDRLSGAPLTGAALRTGNSREEALLIEMRSLDAELEEAGGAMARAAQALTAARQALGQATNRVKVLEEEREAWASARREVLLERSDEEAAELAGRPGSEK